jgi:hypothetical protein
VASTPDRYVWKVSPESIYTLYKALVETVWQEQELCWSTAVCWL